MSTALELIGPHLASSTPAPGQAGDAERGWSLPQLSGRLCELSSPRACGQLSFAVRLVREAQACGETAAWIGPRSSSFFPPDVERCGVDLAALPLVRLGSAQEMGRAADQLLRSGAFGLLLLELGTDPLAAPLLTRLLGLAQRHAAAVLFLTEKPSDAPSLSSLISLRAEVLVGAGAARPEGSSPHSEERRFSRGLRALKDKRRAPGWTHREDFRGPAGLR